MTQLIIIMVLSLSLISKTNTFSTFASFKKSYHTIDKPIFIDYFFWIIIAYFSIPFSVLIKGIFSFNLQSLLTVNFLNSFLNSLLVSIISLTISSILTLSSLNIYR